MSFVPFSLQLLPFASLFSNLGHRHSSGCLPCQGTQGNVREVHSLINISGKCQGNLVLFAMSGTSDPFH